MPELVLASAIGRGIAWTCGIAALVILLFELNRGIVRRFHQREADKMRRHLEREHGDGE
jgi:hypothetical protein